MKRAKTVAFISEHTKSFTAAMRDGAVATAQDLGLKIVANIGINTMACATGETCSKPGQDALTKLIPAGGNVPAHRLEVRRLLYAYRNAERTRSKGCVVLLITRNALI